MLEKKEREINRYIIIIFFFILNMLNFEIFYTSKGYILYTEVISNLK
jgi:hypothetical protein